MSQLSKLSYYQPENPRPRTSLRIPGSHTLYVGPSACARRHALYEAEYGDPSHVSTLAITEADIISGSYVQAVGDAVQVLLDTLRPMPRIIFLVFFCIDDFLGTDGQQLLSALSRRFPRVRFTDEHINPISVDSPTENTLMSKRHLGLYSFLEPTDRRDRGLTFLGNFVPLDPDCELFAWLKAWGVPEYREMFRCQTYEDYQAMAKSQLCLGFRFPGQETMDFFQNQLNMPFCFFPPEYGADRVADRYHRLAAMLGRSCPPELEAQRQAAETEAALTAELFGQRGVSLALDGSAFLRPFAAALALARYGFRVAFIFRGRRIWEDELPMEAELKTRYQVQVLPIDDYGSLSLREEGRSCLALGSASRGILGARWYVDVWHDEGYFGFQGIRKLMAQLREEVASKWQD